MTMVILEMKALEASNKEHDLIFLLYLSESCPIYDFIKVNTIDDGEICDEGDDGEGD